MKEVIGNEKAANILSSEIAVFYYAFFARKNKNIPTPFIFTSYKENGIIIVLGAILGLFSIEALGTHFLLAIWNHNLAWVITALSIYSCLQLFAHIRAITCRPIVINRDSLDIHNGLAGDAHIYLRTLTG